MGLCAAMGAHSSDLRGLAADQVISLIAEYFHGKGISLSQAFAFLDTDASNSVTWEEFSRGIEYCLENSGHHRVTSSELWPIFKRFDRNNDGRISLDEFSQQFCPARRGSVARSWYEDDIHLRSGRHPVGFGAVGHGHAAYIRPAVMDARRVDDVIARIASAIVRTGFTPMQLFQSVDLDSNGRLSWSELERVILTFQPDLSLTERQDIFRRFDRDGTNDVDVNEFCNTLNGCNPSALVSMEAKMKALGDKFRATGQTISQAFHTFDRNYDGYLTRDEWFRAMRTFQSYGASMTEADIEAVFRRFDINGDGLMSIQEFHTFFQDAIDRSVSAGGAYYNGAAPGYGNAPYDASYGYGARPGVMPTYIAPPVEAAWETEVLDLTRQCLSVGRSGLSITEVFRRLDVDHTNSMSMMEFQRMITAYRPDLTASHIDSLFRKVNTSGSGQINLSEFIRRFG